jgi:Rrf2 family protein
MLRLPAQATYATLALVRLAQAPGQRATVASLAADDLPGPFLVTIMGRLRAAGYVASARGRHGGYVLVRDPATISVADILDQLDGHLPSSPVPLGAIRPLAHEQLSAAVDGAVRRSLTEITVASLAGTPPRPSP